MGERRRCVSSKGNTVHTPSVVGGDAKIEEYLDKKGVSWQLHVGVDADLFDVEKSLRNQARFIAVDEKRVDQYAGRCAAGTSSLP